MLTKEEDTKETCSCRHHNPMKKVLMLIIFIIIIGGAFCLGRMSSYRKGALMRGTFSKTQLSGNLPKQGMMPNQKLRTGRGMGFQVSGTIATIDGNNITIKDASGKITTAVISTTTSLSKAGAIAKQSDLQVGNSVGVRGTSDSSGNLDATFIQIN
jgi:hypothetical protein